MTGPASCDVNAGVPVAKDFVTVANNKTMMRSGVTKNWGNTPERSAG
ncbi:MAG: hypothetical protein Q3962_05420 [Corynebacterium sp.]|nr:hypothetical protein [Corynebacterium sp.]